MEVRRYQWVGLLAGVPLFSGAWLSAYYQTPWWGVLGLVLAVTGIYIGNKVEPRADIATYIKRGAIAGLLAAAVARILGWAATMLSGNTDVVQFSELRHFSRAVLSGDVWATLLVILIVAVAGAAVAALEPAAKGKKR